MDIVLSWANEFNARHMRKTWKDEDYLEAIDAWFHKKVQERYLALE
jgi:hypothetical protein